MKTLIIGASGKIGKFFDNKNKNQVLTYNKNKIENGIKFDICKDDISKLIIKNNVNKVVFLGAVSDPDICFSNKRKSENINVKFTKKIIDKLINKNVYLIFLSSEFVFSGQQKKYNENSKISPINLYGKQKAKIEKYIVKKLDNYAILRISKTYGDDLKINGLITSFINEIILDRKVFRAATNQVFNPLFVKDLKKIIFFFLKNKIKGIYNVGGPKAKSRYEIYKIIIRLLSQKFILNNIKIHKEKIENFKFIEKRPKNLSFNINKLKKKIDFQLTDVETVINKIIKKINEKKFNRRQKS